MNELMRRIVSRAEIDFTRTQYGNVQCSIRHKRRELGERVFRGVGPNIEEAFCDAMVSVFLAAVGEPS